MWFKNLCIFRLTDTFTLTNTELEQQLNTLSFHPCGGHEPSSMGWSPPLGGTSDHLLHACNGFILLVAKKEERVLPTSVINEMVQEKIIATEDQQGYKLSKKERTKLKDDTIFELLPKAFTFSKKFYAYLDPQGGWLIIDSASNKNAEDVVSLLRQSLGSLQAIPVHTNEKPSAVMTRWLTEAMPPQNITISDECELRSPDESGGIIRCKRHDLNVPEIHQHLDKGKQVIKLAITWSERMAFIIDEHFMIKRLRFLDLIQDQIADIETNNEIEQLDANFSIMTAELAAFLPQFLEMFGGEVKA
ncbi:MAG: recombination-associated protein RdgC [Methylovulum sp.]|jgi:recombination associated protein RdgC